MVSPLPARTVWSRRSDSSFSYGQHSVSRVMWIRLEGRKVSQCISIGWDHTFSQLRAFLSEFGYGQRVALRLTSPLPADDTARAFADR